MQINTHFKPLFTFIEKAFAITFLTVCTISIGICGYWYFIQDDRIITEIHPYVIVNAGNPTVKSGSTMILEREYCLNTNEYEGDVHRQYSNHIIYQIPDTSTLNTPRKIGCSTRRIAVEVPSNLPTDNYTYDVKIVYQLNPIKKVVYEMPPAKIRVVNELQDRVQQIINKEEK